MLARRCDCLLAKLFHGPETAWGQLTGFTWPRLHSLLHTLHHALLSRASDLLAHAHTGASCSTRRCAMASSCPPRTRG